jgi:predicted DNA-binding protein
MTWGTLPEDLRSRGHEDAEEDAREYLRSLTNRLRSAREYNQRLRRLSDRMPMTLGYEVREALDKVIEAHVQLRDLERRIASLPDGGLIV